MKKSLIIGLMLLTCFSYSFGQAYCENFKIVSILDFPPSPQTPGGNYFLLLLTVHEDNLSNSTIYTNLFFIDELGDTISIPTGANSHLPIYATDTIPYILKLSTTSSNQDFPTDFNGKLVILHPSHPECQVSYSTISTGIEEIDLDNTIAIYPNPVTDILIIKSEKQVDKIVIFNSIGQTIEEYFPTIETSTINLSGIQSGVYFVVLQLANGETVQRKILKI